MFKPRFSILFILMLMTVVAHYLTKRRYAYGLTQNGGLVQNTMVPFVIDVDQPMTFMVGDRTWQTNANFRQKYIGLCGCYRLVSNNRLEDPASPIQIFDYHTPPVQADGLDQTTAR